MRYSGSKTEKGQDRNRQIARRDRAVDRGQKKIRALIGRKSMLEEIDDER